MTEVTKEFIQKNEDEKIIEIEIERLRSFKNHPFQVKDDKKMEDLSESIKEYGVLVPGIVRMRESGGYELVAGHRRKRACELARLEKIQSMLLGSFMLIPGIIACILLTYLLFYIKI